MNYVIYRSDEDYLAHHGIKGQKWGIRRYQNEDGSLTAEGREKYGPQYGYENRSMYKAGTITKEQYKQRKRELKNDGAGFYDYQTNGRTRRLREFQRRHEKGYKVASTVFGAISGLALGATAIAAAAPIGVAAVTSLLGAAGGAVGGYVGQKADNFKNRKMLDMAYNTKTS